MTTQPQHVLPLYFDKSIAPQLAAEIIAILSELSLSTTGHSLEIDMGDSPSRQFPPSLLRVGGSWRP